jgi:hypothetical protein
MRLTRYLKINEAAYAANIGFEEMVKFYKKASDDEIEEMENIIQKADWEKFKKLIKAVLGVILK